MSGWLKLHRKMVDWEWISDPKTVALWIFFLLKANYTQNTWRGVIINPGELVIGRKSLSEQTGLSEQEIRTCISKLKKSKNVTSKSTNKFTVISIVNWELYQDETSQSTSNPTNEQPTSNQRATTLKEGKKERKKEEERKAKKSKKISFDELTVDHIQAWLTEKRVAGKYLMIDEHELLEMFKDYCRSKNPKYLDYAAAFRNAFKWKNVPMKGKSNGAYNKPPTKHDRIKAAGDEAAKQILDRYEAEAEAEEHEALAIEKLN